MISNATLELTFPQAVKFPLQIILIIRKAFHEKTADICGRDLFPTSIVLLEMSLKPVIIRKAKFEGPISFNEPQE